MGKGESLETLEQPTLFHSFKKHLLSACQALRPKDAKDPLTVSAAWRLGKGTSTLAKALRHEAGHLQMLMIFKPI